MTDFYLELDLAKRSLADVSQAVSDEDLKRINSLHRNGPLKKLAKEDIHTRSIIIMGEEPTSKQSIHPEGIYNNRKVNTLSKLATLLPGCPMMVGHRLDKTPWGRTFAAQVLTTCQGYKGAVVKESFWFLNDDEGNTIARKIDAGIWAEGSISYWFKEARCSICHKPMASISFLGMQSKTPRCKHRLGKLDDETGQICYWYPYAIQQVAETSYVFKGAYPKTRSFLAADKSTLLDSYSQQAINAAVELETQLLDAGLDLQNLNQGEPDDSTQKQTDTDQNHRPDPTQEPSDTRNGQSQKTPVQIPASTPQTPEGSEPHQPDPDSTQNQDDQSPQTHQTPGIDSNNTGNTPTNSEPPQPPATGDPGEPHRSSNEPSPEDGNTNGTPQTPEPDPHSDNTLNSEKDRLINDNPDEKLARGQGQGKGGKKQRDGGASKCVCPKCDYEIKHEKGKPCNTLTCPNCNVPLEGKNDGSTDDNTPPEPDSRNIAQPPSTPHDSHSPPDKDSSTPDPQDAPRPADGQPDGSDFYQALTDGLVPEDIAFHLQDILVQDELDFDEKETALRELLALYPDVLGKGLACLALLRLSADTAAGLPAEELRLCIDCEEHFAADTPESCPHCGGTLLLLAEHTAVLFRPVGPLKPKKAGATNNEFFKQDAFRKLPAGTYFVEPKYDGVWMELHKKGGAVKLFTDEGNEYSDKFPKLVAEAQALKATNFIIAGELTRWRGRQRLRHEDVTSWLHKKQDHYDDKEFKYKPFDMMLFLGRDITAEPLEKRRAHMDSIIKWGKQIHPTAHRVIKHTHGDAKLITAINDRKTREGAMVKNIDGRYRKADQKLLYKWKRQYELDVAVTAVTEKKGGGWVYSCSVGRGKNVKPIGETFATKIKATTGDIIQVSVDHVRYDKEQDRYSWFAPKVLSLRTDKNKPDPLSTVKKIAQLMPAAPPTAHIITLTDVVPRLKRAAVDVELFLTGGLVEQGLVSHDIDIVTQEELTEVQVAAILEALGQTLSPYVDFIHDPDGPAGPSLPIRADMADKDGLWKYSNRFVLQEHGWGKKVHYDIRFGAPRTKRMWGWTLFSMPPTAAGTKKTRCQEKHYHDPKWMDVDTKSIKPGQPGNPTKNLTAWMTKIDSGTYDYIRRKPQFLELVLHGKKLKGRYVWREVQVKAKSDSVSDANRVSGDEVGTKSDKIWIMWKPKDQTPSAPIKKMAYKVISGCLVYWETDQVDTELEAIDELAFETEGDLPLA